MYFVVTQNVLFLETGALVDASSFTCEERFLNHVLGHVYLALKFVYYPSIGVDIDGFGA